MNQHLLLATVIAECLFVVSSAKADIVTLVDPANEDNRIVTIQGIEISGTANDGIFDLTFHYGLSYDTLESNVAPASPITWTTFNDATTVVEAIAASVNSAFPSGVSGLRTDDFWIPYVTGQLQDGELRVAGRAGNNASDNNYGDWVSSIGSFNVAQDMFVSGPWVTSAPSAVPEPSAFLYGGLISVLAGCGYRIKQRLAVV